MITKFNNYINESRKSIDDLEILTSDELGWLLHYAVLEKTSPDFQFIQDLIYVGCPIEFRDDFGQTALHWAANYGKIDILKFLISKGADIHARDDQDQTALHRAARNGYLEMVEFLISIGADIEARDKWGRTAWDMASFEIKRAVPELYPNK